MIITAKMNRFTSYSIIYFFFTTEQLLLKNHIEKLSFLTRKDKSVAEKDVIAKLGDNVSFMCVCCA